MKINIRSYLRENIAKLDEIYHDTLESKTVCEYLLMHHLNCSRAELYLKTELELSKSEYFKLQNNFEKLCENIPLQYITGNAPFRHLMLDIEKGILIPRPETEELVELIIQEENLSETHKILDACTGSGCIAIALKTEYQHLNVSAFDVDEKVLKLAQKNAEKHHADIDFAYVDLLANEQGKRFENIDIIVSNPPYVLESEKDEMSNRVLQYEPHLALFVKDDNPLLYYKKIIEQFIKKGRRFYFEINPLTVKAWEKYLSDKNVIFSFFKDMQGRTRFMKILSF